MSYEYLIDGLLPQNEIHILAGPSGVGVSHLLQQMMQATQTGSPFLGRSCSKLPFAFFPLDQSPSAISRLRSTMGIAGLPKPCNVEGASYTLPELLRIARESDPAVRVLFIEPFLDLLPPDAWNFNRGGAASSALRSMNKLAETEKITIVATSRCKPVHNISQLSARSQLEGPTCLSNAVSTVMLMHWSSSGQGSNSRELIVLPKTGRSIWMEGGFNEEGLLEFTETTPSDTDKGTQEFLAKLEKYAPGDRFTTPELLRLDPEASRATVFRRVERLVGTGVLERMQVGLYRIPFKN